MVQVISAMLYNGACSWFLCVCTVRFLRLQVEIYSG
jgi:hypothetical protein